MRERGSEKEEKGRLYGRIVYLSRVTTIELDPEVNRRDVHALSREEFMTGACFITR